MFRQQSRVLDSISQIKDVIFKQQQALAEQRSYDQQNLKSAGSEGDDESNNFADKLEGSGGFAGADAKKRRGRAAPPGRCHSCNRAETPECVVARMVRGLCVTLVVYVSIFSQ